MCKEYLQDFPSILEETLHIMFKKEYILFQETFFKLGLLWLPQPVGGKWENVSSGGKKKPKTFKKFLKEFYSFGLHKI